MANAHPACHLGGAVFFVDDGVRVEGAADRDGAFDPAAPQAGSGWLLIAGPDGASSATASDGLSFTDPGQFTAGDRPFHARAGVALPDTSGYHLHGHFTEPHRNVITVYSPGGACWTAEGGLSPTGGTAIDAGVAVPPAGTFRMAYRDVIPE